MKLIQILPLAALALSLTACVDDDKNVQEVNCIWPEGNVTNVTFVTDPDGIDHVYEASTLNFNYRLDKGEVQISAMSIPLTETRKVNFVLPVTKYSTTQYGAFMMTIPNAMTGNNINLSSFSAGTVIRYLTGSMRMVNYYYATMNIDDYKVSVIQTANSYYGETKVNYVTGNPDTYTGLDTYYDMQIDAKKMTAEINIYNAKFASNMPVQTRITLKDVPITLSHKGIHFQADEIIPLQTNGAPKPEFAITQLSGDAGQGTGLQLSFRVADTWQVNASCGYYARAI